MGPGLSVRLFSLSRVGVSMGGRRRGTSMIGGWPLTPTRMLDLVRTTSMSRPFRVPETGIVMSTSRMDWVHL